MRKTIALFALATAMATTPTLAAAKAKSLPVGSCINLGNTFETGKKYDLGPDAATAADFERIKAAGFDTVRIPVRWDDRSHSSAPYTVDPAWMKRVQGAVDAALAADLKVILNSHHFQPIHETPVAVQPWHTGVWKQIATRFADYPTDRLWFELENEPHDKFTNDNLWQVLDPALAIVRQSNPDRPVIIGGQMWSGIDSLAILELPDDANIYPTFHYYDPFDFTHQGAEWVAPDIPPPGRVYGTAADSQKLASDVAKIKAYTDRTGLVPFMGETGAYDKHVSLSQRVQYAKAVHDAFAPAGVDVCQWAYKNTFPLYDKNSGTWLPGMLGALGLNEPAGSNAPASQPAKAGGSADDLAALDKQLPGNLANDPTRIDWPTQGAMNVEAIQDDAIPGGGAARRYTVGSKPANMWEEQTLMPLTVGIERGQTMTVGFYARTVSADTSDGKGVLAVRFQQNAPPYSGFADTTLKIGPDWQWYEVSGTADRRISKDVAMVSLQLGGAKQVVEIGQAIAVEGSPRIASTAPTAVTPVSSAEIEMPDSLRNAGTLINDPSRRQWSNNADTGSYKERAEPKIWQQKATRYTTTAVGEYPWDLVAGVPIEGAIAEGDDLIIAIVARTESAAAADGKAKVALRIQETSPPYDGFAENVFSVGPNWQLIRIRTKATKAFGPGAAQLALHFAGAVQSVDIGPVYVFKAP